MMASQETDFCTALQRDCCRAAQSPLNAAHMAFKLPDFTDRAKAAAEARKAKLDKFKAAPPPDEGALAARAKAAEKRAEREEQRKLERADRARLAEEARLAKELEAVERSKQAKLEAIAREAAQKAARDARYAARKSKIR